MSFTYLRRAAIVLALFTVAGCSVKSTEPPTLTGPSGLALTLNVTATPDSISQDGGSQSSVRVTAIGPDGNPVPGLPIRVDTFVNGVAQDFGKLSAPSIVTQTSGSDKGVASVVYTAPPAPPNGIFTQCPSSNLPGSCVTIVFTPTSTNFATANPQSVLIRLVPTGVILPPAGSPTAAFTVSPTPATAGISLHFDASTSKAGTGATAITNYSWDFGDGTTDTGKTPAHTFNGAGSFTVALTVTNERGLTASTTQSIAVSAPAPASLPTPVFTSSPAAPGVNETIFFNASTSTAGAGHSISSYRWTFGDGGTATGVTVSHAFVTAGTYTVQLTVVDDAGQAATSAGTTISVGGPPSPTSNFTFSPTTPSVGQQVVFDASTSVTSQGQTIVDVAWNFGDGTPVIHCPGDPSCGVTTGTNRISAHTYQFVGTFVVNLVVTDSAGRIGSKAVSIAIGPAGPSAVLFLAKTGGVSIQADASGSTATGFNTIASYRFIWGDGSADTVGAASSVAHTFIGAGAAGPHTVTLVVTDSAGKTGATSKDITVP